MLKTKYRHVMAFSIFVTNYETAQIMSDHGVKAALIREQVLLCLWELVFAKPCTRGLQLMSLICIQMCPFLKKLTSARDKFRALAFKNLARSIMYVRHIIYNMVR